MCHGCVSRVSMAYGTDSETMPAPQHYPVRLTQAQRKVVAEIVPDLADRLKLDEPDQRTIEFTVTELKIIPKQVAASLRHASTGMKRNSLRHVADLTVQALDRSQGIGAVPVAERLYQFKIILKDIAPPIWRGIQVACYDKGGKLLGSKSWGDSQPMFRKLW